VTADRGPIDARNCTAQYDDDRLVPADSDDVMPWSEADGIDLVPEGVATVVHDGDTRQGVGAADREKYGWPVTIEDGAFHAPFGAPAAGPPPYQPYAVTPQLVFAFGIDERFAPRSTRWRFAGDRG
jgi:hypothetical protein